MPEHYSNRKMKCSRVVLHIRPEPVYILSAMYAADEAIILLLLLRLINVVGASCPSTSQYHSRESQCVIVAYESPVSSRLGVHLLYLDPVLLHSTRDTIGKKDKQFCIARWD